MSFELPDNSGPDRAEPPGGMTSQHLSLLRCALLGLCVIVLVILDAPTMAYLTIGGAGGANALRQIAPTGRAREAKPARQAGQ